MSEAFSVKTRNICDLWPYAICSLPSKYSAGFAPVFAVTLNIIVPMCKWWNDSLHYSIVLKPDLIKFSLLFFFWSTVSSKNTVEKVLCGRLSK